LQFLFYVILSFQEVCSIPDIPLANNALASRVHGLFCILHLENLAVATEPFTAFNNLVWHNEGFGLFG